MKPETAEWVAKAEGDFRTARREQLAAEWPNYDAACFHAQQCAEKYLKAFLIEANIPFPKVHDLEALLNLALSTEPAWEELREGLRQLTDLAVEVRYPGLNVDAEDATLAVSVAASISSSVRAALGIVDS
jgi:HEPN domain-containing protein